MQPKTLTDHQTVVHVEAGEILTKTAVTKLQDVNAVMKRLNYHLYHHGDELHEKDQDFSITPDHLFCICEQVQMPLDELVTENNITLIIRKLRSRGPI